MSDTAESTEHVGLKLKVSAYGFLFDEFLVTEVDQAGLSLREMPDDDETYLTSLSWSQFCEGYQNGHIELHHWEGQS